MKVVVNDGQLSEEIKYPCLMKENTCDLVVLFTSSCKGTVICTSSDWLYVGEYCNEWNMDCFNPFKGKITLSND